MRAILVTRQVDRDHNSRKDHFKSSLSYAPRAGMSVHSTTRAQTAQSCMRRRDVDDERRPDGRRVPAACPASVSRQSCTSSYVQGAGEESLIAEGRKITVFAAGQRLQGCLRGRSGAGVFELPAWRGWIRHFSCNLLLGSDVELPVSCRTLLH